MPAGLIVRLRPTGPWRFGPDSGARDRVERLCHSDTLYSAVTSAMLRLGSLEEWLDATARAAEPAVRLSSCFPALGNLLFVPPPANLWPPPASGKVRWKGARFVPVEVVESMLGEHPLEEERWAVDGVSECLIPVGERGPFRIALRHYAAVDRLTPGFIEPHSTTCLEFTLDGGMWAAVSFADEEARERWIEPVKSAFRLLADSGLGGERSQGWGRSDTPEFKEGELPGLLIQPRPAAVRAEPAEADPSQPPEPVRHVPPPETAYWLLSLFSPAEGDPVDWSRGSYSLVAREGRIESAARSGDLKKPVRMVKEGSVLLAASAPRGAAPDVAPDGFPHPVYRAGFSFSIPIPWKVVL